jgi:hypothetical protein
MNREKNRSQRQLTAREMKELSQVALNGAAIPYLRICEQGLVNLKEGRTQGLFPNQASGKR